MLTCFDPASPVFLVAPCAKNACLASSIAKNLISPTLRFIQFPSSETRRSLRVAKAMLTMGYFRAPRRLYGSKPDQRKLRRCESLHAALLVDDDDGDAVGEAAAATGAVPKGYFAVYVGEEARRFVVPTSYLRRPAFRQLVELAAEEFGFGQAGGLRIPCREEEFEAVVAALEAESQRGGGRRGAAPGTTRWSRLAGSSRCS